MSGVSAAEGLTALKPESCCSTSDAARGPLPSARLRTEAGERLGADVCDAAPALCASTERSATTRVDPLSANSVESGAARS